MLSNKNIGKLGEKMVSDFLRKKGFKIVETNYQKRIGEIDIIARKKDILHFIEVKARSKSSIEEYGLPQDAVNEEKKRKIITTAMYYMQEAKCPDDTCWQIDVAAIIIDWKKNKAKLCFIENAVEDR